MAGATTTRITDPGFDWWLCGFLHSNPGSTVADAVAHWQEQDRLAAEFDAQNAATVEG